MPNSKKKSEAAQVPPRAGTKLHKILKQLQGPKGTSLNRMMKTSGWQAHTVRAALTGLRKRGYAVQRQTDDAGRATYFIGEG